LPTVTEDREAAEVHLDALGHVDVDVAEEQEGGDRGDASGQLGPPQVVIDVAEHSDCTGCARQAETAGALRAAEHRDGEMRRLSLGLRGRRMYGQIPTELVELGDRPRL